jgi:hypothetical protein
MTAKSFCYACAGIFLLVCAWTMGARHARADFDPTLQGHVIGMARWFGNSNCLRSDGTLWRLGSSGWTQADQNAYLPLPVPVSDILFWEFDRMVTKTGHGWHYK